jgi:uncharacterized protein with von Willebrand factor type A (vWA) domain
VRSRRRTQPGAEKTRLRIEEAMRQLERAELYVMSAEQLLIHDPALRRLMEDLRGEVVAARRRLDRPPDFTILSGAG